MGISQARRLRCGHLTVSFLTVLAVLWAGACQRADEDGPSSPPLPEHAGTSPNARFELVEEMTADRDAVRHPSDGGGSAWLEAPQGAPAAARVRSAGSWRLVYEAGPLGVAVGGMIFFQTSPFWGWSPPQTETPHAPGYTEVSTDAEGVVLRPFGFGGGLLGIEVAGRGLVGGDRLQIVYGAGPAGAVADRFAERREHFWIAVDGDGDGVRALLEGSPEVDVLPGPPARLLLILPTTARPGETVNLTAAVLDPLGNMGVPWEGEIELIEPPPGWNLPQRLRLGAGDFGRTRVPIQIREEGVYRVRARISEHLEAESNPLVVSKSGPRVLWGDLQIHSGLSDGTGTPEDIYRYAREVAALDVAAITDHDHWGLRFLDTHPELWQEIRRQTAAFHEPGRFVTLLGYEWTSWLHGHRHVLFFDGDGEVLSSMDPRFDTPEELWAGLKGKRAITITHHTAGEPIAANWSIPPDPGLEPVTEICSVHGSSEAADSPRPVRGAIPGNYARDALDRGYRLGFLGSTDGHDGHPGLGQIASGTGGLAAILSEELTRDGVLAALRERRVYATNGPRILLRFGVAGSPMGSAISTTSLRDGPAGFFVSVVAPGPLDRIDLIRSGGVVQSWDCEGRREIALSGQVAGLSAGEYLYVRVVQTDEGMAWSSPVWVD